MSRQEKNAHFNLTLKQQRFARIYALSGNATSAAIQAGYSPKNPSQLAWQALQKPTVLAAVQHHRKRIQDKYSDLEKTIIYGLYREAMNSKNARQRVEALIALARITGLLPYRKRK